MAMVWTTCHSNSESVPLVLHYHECQGDPVLSRQASRHLEALFWANTFVPSLVVAPAITKVVNQITETAMGNVMGRYGKREGGG